jgi:putative FmdB family regulatory protein
VPLYDFNCETCHKTFEKLVRKEADIPSVVCPDCGSDKVTRALSLPAAPLSTTAQSAGACGVGPPCGASWCQRKG